jgi:RecA-family ATPase
LIYIISDKYEALNYQNEIVKDIENVCKSMGLKRRDIENIKFASRG